MILDVESSRENAHWEFPEWVEADARSRRELLRFLRKNENCHLSDTDKSFGQFMEDSSSKLMHGGPLPMAQLASRINTLLLNVAERLCQLLPTRRYLVSKCNQLRRSLALGGESFQGYDCTAASSIRPVVSSSEVTCFSPR